MDQILDALRHRWRRRILRMIGEAGESGVSATEMAARFDFTLGDASYHARRMLTTDELLIVVRTKAVSGSVEKFYLIAPDVNEIGWFREIVDLSVEGD